MSRGGSGQSTVLYDALGPRGRRRVLLGSIVAGVVVLAVLYLVVGRLQRQGQLSWQLWGPLLDPSNEVFDAVWRLLGQGFKATVSAAALAIALSLVIGTLLGMLRLSLRGVGRFPVVGLVELLRGLPVVISIFLAARLLPEFGVNLSNMWYLVIGLTAYNSVIIAEIVRAGVNSLPRGQREAGLAIGLTPGQTLRTILLPQAFRVMLPGLISQLVVVVKDTSLAAVVLAGFTEALNSSKAIYQNLNNPLQVYTVVGVLFIIINYTLSKLAEWVERRTSRRTSGKPVDEGAASVPGAPLEVEAGAAPGVPRAGA
ncbi:MAG: amino acid ABC transporter permease [Actinomycetes bacterium]